MVVAIKMVIDGKSYEPLTLSKENLNLLIHGKAFNVKAICDPSLFQKESMSPVVRASLRSVYFELQSIPVQVEKLPDDVTELLRMI